MHFVVEKPSIMRNKKTDTASSDIDLMVISDEISYGDLFTALEAASVTLGRPVNPTILTKDEFRQRLAKQESFLTRVMEQPKIWIVGEDDGTWESTKA